MEGDAVYDYENDAIDAEKAQELAAVGFNNDLKTVMGSMAGRKFVAMLLFSVCDIDGKHFTGNSKTYFNLGRRDVGRFLSELLQQECFEDYILMLRDLRGGFKVKEEVKNG